MTGSDLIRNLAEYGADVNCVNSRFLGDLDLYTRFFHGLFEETSIRTLEKSMMAGDCKHAFEAAHELKGIAGNLGLTPFYQSVSALVEMLRSGDFDSAVVQYSEVDKQMKILAQYI